MIRRLHTVTFRSSIPKEAIKFDVFFNIISEWCDFKSNLALCKEQGQIKK